MFSTGDVIGDYVSATNGLAYVTSGHQLCAVDLSTGSQRWAFDAGTGTLSQPVPADGVIYTIANSSSFAEDSEDDGAWLYAVETNDETVSGAQASVGNTQVAGN